MDITKLLVELIDKHPGMTIIYIITIIFATYLTIYVIRYYFPSLTKVSNSKKDEDIRLIKKQLEDIYREVTETRSNNKNMNEILTDIRIKLEVILEKLRGKEL